MREDSLVTPKHSLCQYIGATTACNPYGVIQSTRPLGTRILDCRVLWPTHSLCNVTSNGLNKLAS